jgi:hypothetical protein
MAPHGFEVEQHEAILARGTLEHGVGPRLPDAGSDEPVQAKNVNGV